MAAMTGASGWTQLRQQARSLETQTETTLQTYSQFSTVAEISAKPSEEEKVTEQRLQELLEKREIVIGQLTRLLDSETTLTSSALKQNNLALLRDKLTDHRGDLSRLRATLSSARDRANLLGRVRDDIRNSGYADDNPENPHGAEAEYMLAERARIDTSHEVTDSLLSQAYAVQGQFARQREILGNVSQRITAAAGQVPGINQLIGRITAKKRRDGIILGSFISMCFLVFWYFL